MKIGIAGNLDLEADGKPFARIILVAAGNAFFIGRVNLDEVNRPAFAQVDLDPGCGIRGLGGFRTVGPVGARRRVGHPLAGGSGNSPVRRRGSSGSTRHGQRGSGNPRTRNGGTL